MSKKCAIMTRMKNNYEERSRNYLTRRVPVIMRLDGKSFHSYTKGLVKPFDEKLIQDMQLTAQYLCKEIEGVQCAYVQSDEISLLITDYKKLNTEAWFNYAVQKMCSVSASLATAMFNKLRYDSIGKLAMFDSRVFNIPEHDVNNYFVARQRDCIRNSVQMLAQSLYSHKELNKKNSYELKQMCLDKQHDWNKLNGYKKYGGFIIKEQFKNTNNDIRSHWVCKESPIFSNVNIIDELLKNRQV